MNYTQLRSHRRENHLQAFILICGMALVMSVAGYTLAGRAGVWFAITFSAISALVSPALSPKFILQMYRARPIDPREASELYQVFGELVRRAELAHVPALYRVPAGMLNAFAVGADRNAAVGITDGLLRTMSPRELAGILAHELSHLRFGDTHLMALGDVFSRLTATMSRVGQLLLILFLPAALMGTPFISLAGLLVLIFAPLANMLLQLALSRSREFNADLGAVELTGDPAGMASALEKLERSQWGSWWQRIFLPYRAMQPNVLRTHPVTEERIRRLRQLATNASASDHHVPPVEFSLAGAPTATAMGPEILRRIGVGLYRRLAG
jgi:heat shock protein HtpX